MSVSNKLFILNVDWAEWNAGKVGQFERFGQYMTNRYEGLEGANVFFEENHNLAYTKLSEFIMENFSDECNTTS